MVLKAGGFSAPAMAFCMDVWCALDLFTGISGLERGSRSFREFTVYCIEDRRTNSITSEARRFLSFCNRFHGTNDPLLELADRIQKA